MYGSQHQNESEKNTKVMRLGNIFIFIFKIEMEEKGEALNGRDLYIQYKYYRRNIIGELLLHYIILNSIFL